MDWRCETRGVAVSVGCDVEEVDGRGRARLELDTNGVNDDGDRLAEFGLNVTRVDGPGAIRR